MTHPSGSAPGTPGGARRIVLDGGTAAPVHPVAREAYLSALADGWADPRRLHTEGRRARLLLDAARESLAADVGCEPDEVHLPPDHPAAVHAAVLGVAAGMPGDVVTTAVEHSAVLHAAAWLGSRGGDHVSVGVDAAGRLDLDRFALALPGAALAAVQLANGEIGTAQPLPAVADLTRRHGVVLVVDSAGVLGFMPAPQEADVLVGAPRTWGSVPGAGLLVVRRHVRWRPYGPGEAESAALRPGEHAGEVDVPAAIAAAASLRAVLADRAGARRLEALVDRVRTAAAALPDVEVAGDPVARAPHVVTFSALYLPGELLVGQLDALGFAVGSGSACTSDTLQPSHVLAATGGLTHGNVRIVLHPAVTASDVDRLCAVLPGLLARVRRELGADGL